MAAQPTAGRTAARCLHMRPPIAKGALVLSTAAKALGATAKEAWLTGASRTSNRTRKTVARAILSAALRMRAPPAARRVFANRTAVAAGKLVRTPKMAAPRTWRPTRTTAVVVDPGSCVRALGPARTTASIASATQPVLRGAATAIAAASMAAKRIRTPTSSIAAIAATSAAVPTVERPRVRTGSAPSAVGAISRAATTKTPHETAAKRMFARASRIVVLATAAVAAPTAARHRAQTGSVR